MKKIHVFLVSVSGEQEVIGANRRYHLDHRNRRLRNRSSSDMMNSWYKYKKNVKFFFQFPGGAGIWWRETELTQNIISRNVLSSFLFSITMNESIYWEQNVRGSRIYSIDTSFTEISVCVLSDMKFIKKSLFPDYDVQEYLLGTECKK